MGLLIAVFSVGVCAVTLREPISVRMKTTLSTPCDFGISDIFYFFFRLRVRVIYRGVALQE